MKKYMNYIRDWFLTMGKATIIYSRDGKLYYVQDNKRFFPRSWLSVDVIAGEVPEEKRHGTLDGWMQISTDDGRVYHRHVLPFFCYEVKSGKIGRVSRRDDLYLDYVLSQKRS